MILRGPDLNLFPVFEALMAERSVTRAARRLGLSQPAVSEALGRLRRLMDDELFVRTSAGMVPTPRALQAAETVAGALADLQGVAEARSGFDPGTAQRTFRIAATDYAEIVVVSALNRRLRAIARGIHLRMVVADGRTAVGLLDRGLADFAIGVFAPALPKRFDRAVLMAERAVCLARRDHPALQDGLTLEVYAALPHVVGSLTGEVNPAPVGRALAQAGYRREVALTVTSSLSLPAVLNETDLIATQPERTARVLARLGDLALHEPPLPLEPWEVELVWGRRVAGDAAALWLRDAIRDVCRELPDPALPA